MSIDWDIKHQPRESKVKRAIKFIRGLGKSAPLCASNHYERSHFVPFEEPPKHYESHQGMWD